MIFIGSVWLMVVGCGGERQTLTIATTTSTHDSGLTDALFPEFEAQFDAEIDLLAVGTGEALRLGESGDADVVLVHARERELAFMAAGHGAKRWDVMCNDFVLLGAADDSATVKGEADIAAAFARIAAAERPFVSRGDDSGTHIRELSLWEAAGVVPTGDWYFSIGQGQGAMLTFAEQQQAYAISDRGTYIKRAADGLDLEVMVEGDSRLTNQYGLIVVSAEKQTPQQHALANQFAAWFVAADTQAAIADYRVNGQQLFFTDPETCGY